MHFYEGKKSDQRKGLSLVLLWVEAVAFEITDRKEKGWIIRLSLTQREMLSILCHFWNKLNTVSCLRIPQKYSFSKSSRGHDFKRAITIVWFNNSSPVLKKPVNRTSKSDVE